MELKQPLDNCSSEKQVHRGLTCFQDIVLKSRDSKSSQHSSLFKAIDQHRATGQPTEAGVMEITSLDRRKMKLKLISSSSETFFVIRSGEQR